MPFVPGTRRARPAHQEPRPAVAPQSPLTNVMDSITALLPLLKILAAFSAMLAGIRLRLGLGTSILGGAALTALLFGLPPERWPQVVASALANRTTLFLAGIVGLIMALSTSMEKTGQSRRLMEALAVRMRSPRLRLVFFPALIGLLPMPGGAVFSAPMVGEVSRRMSVDAADKALINYWFRHVWELGWPLYPGMILTASLGGLPIHQLIAWTFPAVPLCLLLGWVFVLRPGRLRIEETPAPVTTARTSLAGILVLGLPLLVAIGGAVALEGAIGLLLPGVPFEWGVLAALLAAIVALLAQNGFPLAPVRQTLASRHLYSMLFVIVAIFVFKETMQAAGVVHELAGMAGGEVALLASAVFLPFLVGAISGINVAFVGATFPLLLGILEGLGMQDQTLPYLVLAQFFGFTGVMISPLHICFILTCQFFQVELSRVWRRLVVPCALLAASGSGYFLLIR